MMTRRDPASRHLLVVNPVAGEETETAEIVGAVREAADGYLDLIRVTERAGDGKAFGEEAVAEGVDHIWVAGGDGTLLEVVTGLRRAAADARPVLCPLPLGTGNDLARSLGLPLEWSAAVGALAESSEVLEIDLMDVELDGRKGSSLNAVIAGNGGRIGEVLDDEEKSRWGPLSYLRSAAEVAMELVPIEVTMQVDGGARESIRVMNVVVANGRYAARGVPIAPGARPDDGVLELVVLGEATLAEMLGMLPSLAAEQDPDHEAWTRRRISSLTLEAVGEGRIPVSVDGETTEASVITVTLSDTPIRMRVPSRERQKGA